MSIIYYMECNMCGNMLHYRTELHANGNLHVIVEPCHKCIDKAKLETLNKLEQHHD